MTTIWRKIYRDLTRRKLRSALTVIGIIVGVAGIVAIVSTSKSLTLAQSYAYANNSQEDLSTRVIDASPNLVRAVAQVPNVAVAERRADFYTKWETPIGWRDLYLVGIEDFQNMQVNKIDLVEGSFPQKGQVALEISAKDIGGAQIGQRIVYRDENSREKTAEISGFANSPSYPSATLARITTAYMPAADVRALYGGTGDNQLLIRLNDLQLKEQTKTKIQQVFTKRNVDYQPFKERDPQNFSGKRELEALMMLMLLFSVLGLLISGFLVATTLSALVSEQVGEIGSMKAVGATRWQILRIYILGGLIYGSIGTLVGISLGVVGSWVLFKYIGTIINLPGIGFLVEPLAIGLGCVVGLGVTTVAAVIPAWQGTSITVKEALDSYGINSTYGQGVVDRAFQRIRGLPALPAMSLRNLARRKARNLITLAAIGLAAGAFMAAQSTSASVDQGVDKLYGIYAADMWVWFYKPVGESFAGMLRTLPEVQRVESWSESAATLGDITSDMWGVPPDSTLYRWNLNKGRWLEKGDTDVVVVANNIATKAHLNVGDLLKVDTPEKSGDLRVIGIVNDSSTWLGTNITGKIFVPIRTALRLQNKAGTADFFAVQLDDPSQDRVDAVLSKVEEKFGGLHPGSLATYVDRERSKESTQILSLMLYAMVIIVGTAGGIGVLNTLTLNVLERRREIGVMRSIGGTNIKLVQVFLTEGLFLGLGGYVLGLILAYPLAKLFLVMLGGILFDLDLVMPASAVLGTLAFTVTLALVASLGPALGAARMKVMEALRYE